MRVFVSSTFTDLVEYRDAAIRGLRQVGHEVVAMEDFTAASAPPVERVIELIDDAEVYVGVFGWRYGYRPRAEDCPDTIDYPDGFERALTSITHLEYLRAKQQQLHVLAFLLDDAAAWPPTLMDAMASPRGPDADGVREEPPGSEIQRLRAELRRERIVATFTSPAELQARVVTAVTNLGMGIGLRRSRSRLGEPVRNGLPDSSYSGEIEAEMLRAIGDGRRFTTIDLSSTWWSTRLFLLAALARVLTSIVRIVVVEGPRFVGMVSVDTVVQWLAAVKPELREFEAELAAIGRQPPSAALSAAVAKWQELLPQHIEEGLKDDVDGPTLVHYFGDAFLTRPVEVADLERVTIVDLSAILAYPNDFVPVVAHQLDPGSDDSDPPAAGVPPGPEQLPPLHIVDKQVLNADFASRYLDDLMKQARL